MLLNKEIKNATGVSLTIKTDKYKPGEKPDSAVREILIADKPAGKPKGAVTEGDIRKKQYALVTLDGAKLVIYGSDSQMLRAAVIWFADNCVGNTANTGIGYFRLQRTLTMRCSKLPYPFVFYLGRSAQHSHADACDGY